MYKKRLTWRNGVKNYLKSPRDKQTAWTVSSKFNWNGIKNEICKVIAQSRWTWIFRDCIFFSSRDTTLLELKKLSGLRKMQKTPNVWVLSMHTGCAERRLWLAGKHRKAYYVGKNGLSYVLTLPVRKRSNFWAITKFSAIM